METTTPEVTMWHYGFGMQHWGTVRATSKQQARNEARARHNLRSTRGMWFTEGEPRPLTSRWYAFQAS